MPLALSITVRQVSTPGTNCPSKDAQPANARPATSSNTGASDLLRVSSTFRHFRNRTSARGSISHALAARGHALALPVVAAKRSPLVFRLWRAGDPLIVHVFGMHEPARSAPEVTPDVLLVPLLAFDARGNRLGYGGGFYDRSLAKLRALAHVTAIGFAYEGQSVDAVPRAEYDQPLDAVATERSYRRIG